MVDKVAYQRDVPHMEARTTLAATMGLELVADLCCEDIALS